ncbi:carbon-phosphorus lyase complex subunit PhnI [uncultured Hoeflea sp.]|uniref:carbon-phosphorus lyase complex subunit PhnI n=1 Tax=uncultured Hoeflea sp. TaxID=538666 RepID=UPI002606D261|nr:carbon-phosphorus lyase complex subunit PhnI [uncultured Hoeflea sp.]
MYVAVKGGEAAIANAHKLLAARRRGDRQVPALTLEQIAGQLALAVDRVMGEGSLYDPELAALAVKQARGDLIEAVFLLRAYRTTLPRFGHSEPVDTGKMVVERRISAVYKDLPGGQLLGPTFDYTHRLLDPDLAGDQPCEPPAAETDSGEPITRVSDILSSEGLIEDDPVSDPSAPVADITRNPTEYPMGRDGRLQTLARGDEGFLLALAYSTQRGYARSHPFVGEIRIGEVDVEVMMPELGFAVTIGRIKLTECQMVNQFKGSSKAPPQFTRGYGLVFGQAERKAMAMSLCDRALRATELGEDIVAPAQDEEFVLSHCDNVQATGFVEHLKLPHYVDFQAELDLVRRMRAEHAAREDADGFQTGDTREAAE